MSRRLPRPEKDHILELIREKTNEGGVVVQDRAMLERIRKMRRLDWQVNVPPRLKRMAGGTGVEYRSSAIADTQVTLPSMYTEEDPTLSLQGEGTEAVQGLTTRLEHFTTAALFEDCGKRASGGVPTHHRVIDATFEGGAWSCLEHDSDVWSDYTDMSKAGVDGVDRDGKPLYEDDAPEATREDDEDEAGYRKRAKSYRPKSKYQKYRTATEDAKRKAGVPIRWRSCDAATIVPFYEGDVLWAVAEVQKRSLSAELRKHSLGLNADGEICPKALAVRDWATKAGGSAECDLIKWADKDWQSYILVYNGSSLGAAGGAAYEIPKYTKRHRCPIGRVPYFVNYGGFTMNFEYGRVVTWSASETMRYEVEYLSWLRTIFGYLAIREAMTPLFKTTPIDGNTQVDGKTGRPKGPEVLELGMIYEGTPGQEIKPALPPANADKIQIEIAQTQRDIQGQMPAQKNGDVGNVGGEGFALSTIFEKSRSRFNRFEAGVISHLGEVTLAFWKMLQGLEEDVYVFRNAKKDGGYIKVSPKDLDTPVRPTWKLHVDSTAANIVKQRLWDAMRKSEFASLDQSREAMGMNPDEVQKGQAVDRVRATPTYQQAEDAEVWGAMGRGAWEKKQGQAQQMAAMMSPPSGGPGGVPDTAAMAQSPNQAGATPGTEYQASGIPSSPSVPTQGAVAQAGAGPLG